MGESATSRHHALSRFLFSALSAYMCPVLRKLAEIYARWKHPKIHTGVKIRLIVISYLQYVLTDGSRLVILRRLSEEALYKSFRGTDVHGISEWRDIGRSVCSVLDPSLIHI